MSWHIQPKKQGNKMSGGGKGGVFGQNLRKDGGGGGGGKKYRGSSLNSGVRNPLPTMRILKKLGSKGCKIVKKLFKICIFTLLLRIQTLKMGSRRSKKWSFLITLWNNQVGLICSTCFTSPQIFVRASLDYCAPDLLDETILISISCVL